MVIGWMVDPGFPRAGMVLSVEAFAAAKPVDCELVHCHPDRRPPSNIDIFVLHGDLFDKRWIEVMDGKPILAHRHGGWHAGDPVFRRWILDNASLVTFNSPMQKSLFRYPVEIPFTYIPIPVDVDKFIEASIGVDRSGVVCIGLIVPAKGISYTVDWALRTDTPVDFYGEAPIARIKNEIVEPCRYMGSMDYKEIPGILARYERFVFMPHESDLYCRTVIEAHASGCKLILDGDVNALWSWMDLEACRSAPKFFWETVLSLT